MWTTRTRQALATLIIVVVCPTSQGWGQTASAPYYELFLQTTKGPPTLTFHITSVDNVVWEAVLAGEEQTYLTTDPRYLDPEDITMPGEYSGPHHQNYGWDCNGEVTPVLGRGHYVITVKPWEEKPADTLLVDCYGTSFLGDVTVLYDAVLGAFKVGGQVVHSVDLYDDPDGLQPTPPRNLRCTNSRSFGEHPHLAWDAPEHPQGATITYDIFRDVGDGYHKLNTSPLTATEYTDTGARILRDGNPSYYYVTATAAHSPESDPSNTVVVNTDIAAKPVAGREGAGTRSANATNKPGISLLATPNPFNATTTLHYHLTGEGKAQLRVFDASGRLVTVLASGRQQPGTYRVRFEGSNLPSGVYVAVLTFGGRSTTQKLLLVK